MCLLNHQWNIADNGNEEIIKDSFPLIENVEKKSHKNTTRLVWMGFSRCPILSVSHPPLAGHYSALDPVYVVFTFSLWWMVVLVCVWRTLKLTFYDPHLAQRTFPSPSLCSPCCAVLHNTLSTLSIYVLSISHYPIWFIPFIDWCVRVHLTRVDYNKNKKHRGLCTNRSRPSLTPGHALLLLANPGVGVPTTLLVGDLVEAVLEHLVQMHRFIVFRRRRHFENSNIQSHGSALYSRTLSDLNTCPARHYTLSIVAR